jgi:hypothetical protein
MKKPYRPKHKYHAKRTIVDDINFDSKKEARYYQELLIRQRIGEVIFFLRQVPFHLPGNVTYRVDFQEFRSDGTVAFVDVKGFETEGFVMKKKMVESLYPVTIEVV